jgi:hypothetical protein
MDTDESPCRCWGRRASRVGDLRATEQASHTTPLPRPPSSSAQRWCSATKATKASSRSRPSMGAGAYHSAENPGQPDSTP